MAFEKIKKIQLKYITLIFSIIGIILLYSLSLTQQPIIIDSVQSIEEFEGKEVTLSGIIQEYQSTSYGNQLIHIKCNNTTLTVFSESPLTLHIGDKIKATGTIQKYKDSWELILSNPKSATIINSWQNRTIQIVDLANHPKDYLDIPINITGFIDLKYDDIIYIRDLTHNNTIPLVTPFFSTPDTSTKIYAHAQLYYDSINLRYLLKDCSCLEPIRNNNGG